ncbi:hypothetical protein [Halalkalicoccus tibetensis]|uniref:Uncharacterized protein n=1 Tax=Halalkalicoccus tibetensis TaxID=175632 RepID=A0ABD5V9V3_9EURY
MDRAIAVEADLELAVEGHPVSMTGSGTHLTVGLESVSGAIAVLRSLGTITELIGPLGSRFVDAELSADVAVGGTTVARIGPHVEPTALSRALGVAPARVWPGAAARVAVREIRP